MTSMPPVRPESVREPACLGCYAAEPQALRAQLDRLFTSPDGPGLPKDGSALRCDQPLRAILVPHMDYARGGVTYGWGFHTLVQQTDARLFVIIGTSHYSPHRFTLTREHFRTPLGTTETDQVYIDRLVEAYGDGLFADPRAHAPEHSIELEVILLQHMFAGKREFRIVPLLVGSFFDAIRRQQPPDQLPDVRRMIRALQAVEAATPEPICYLISGDLAHIGPKFDDPTPVHSADLEHCRGQDHALLGCLEAGDVAGYFQVIAQELDRRRICGLSPTYTLLRALAPCVGRRLHYQQYLHPRGYESVSFASVAFYGV